MGPIRRPALVASSHPSAAPAVAALLAAADAAAECNDRAAGIAAIQALYAHFSAPPRAGMAINLPVAFPPTRAR